MHRCRTAGEGLAPGGQQVSWKQQVALHFPPGISLLHPVSVGFVNHHPCQPLPDQAEVPQAGRPNKEAEVGRDVSGWIRDCGLGGLARMLHGRALLKSHIRAADPAGRGGAKTSLETPRLRGQHLCRVQSRDRMPWVPLTLPAPAAEDAGVTSRIPLCPIPF